MAKKPKNSASAGRNEFDQIVRQQLQAAAAKMKKSMVVAPSDPNGGGRLPERQAEKPRDKDRQRLDYMAVFDRNAQASDEQLQEWLRDTQLVTGSPSHFVSDAEWDEEAPEDPDHAQWEDARGETYNPYDDDFDGPDKAGLDLPDEPGLFEEDPDEEEEEEEEEAEAVRHKGLRRKPVRKAHEVEDGEDDADEDEEEKGLRSRHPLHLKKGDEAARGDMDEEFASLSNDDDELNEGQHERRALAQKGLCRHRKSLAKCAICKAETGDSDPSDEWTDSEEVDEDKLQEYQEEALTKEKGLDTPDEEDEEEQDEHDDGDDLDEWNIADELEEEILRRRQPKLRGTEAAVRHEREKALRRHREARKALGRDAMELMDASPFFKALVEAVMDWRDDIQKELRETQKSLTHVLRANYRLHQENQSLHKSLKGLGALIRNENREIVKSMTTGFVEAQALGMTPQTAPVQALRKGYGLPAQTSRPALINGTQFDLAKALDVLQEEFEKNPKENYKLSYDVTVLETNHNPNLLSEKAQAVLRSHKLLPS